MANADYITRGSGYICPTATLLNSPSPSTTVFYIDGYTAQDGALPAVGSGVMVNGEIMRLVGVTLTQIEVARGCADTIPKGHAAMSRIWFFDGGKTGYDGREYMASETIGVKILMKTAGSAMEPKNSPPNALTFNSRFARPYAPGLVTVNGNPFHQAATLDIDTPTLTLSWAHRDRISQMDQLMGHEIGNVGPEIGTTYTVELFKGEEVSPRLTTSGIVGTSYTLGFYDAVSALDLSDEVDAPAHLTLKAVRGLFDSWQAYRINLAVDASSVDIGWGNSFGLAWGG